MDIRAGRDEALSRLFEAHYADVVRLAFYLTGSWAVAEELAQEAFVRLWRRWGGCATGTPPSARPTTRTCGNAACSPRCVFGRPNAAALAGVSATSRVVPSIASTRYPRYHAPLVSGVANGRATSTNSRRSGSAPSRALALAIAGVEGTRHHCCQRPVQPSPPASSRATSS
jgi:Sigma-70 region 2